jgi:hypothetical protein
VAAALAAVGLEVVEQIAEGGGIVEPGNEPGEEPVAEGAGADGVDEVAAEIRGWDADERLAVGGGDGESVVEEREHEGIG